MARIFYFPDGAIYGVHPGPHEDNPKIKLPDGVAWIDVPETADKIVWPPLANGPGGERTTLVIDGALTVKVLPAKDKHGQLSQMLSAYDLTVDDLRALIPARAGPT